MLPPYLSPLWLLLDIRNCTDSQSRLLQLCMSEDTSLDSHADPHFQACPWGCPSAMYCMLPTSHLLPLSPCTHPGGDGVVTGEHANSQGPVPAFGPKSGPVFCHWLVSLCLPTASPSYHPWPNPHYQPQLPSACGQTQQPWWCTCSQSPCCCQVPTVGISSALLFTTCVSATGSCYYTGTCSRPSQLSVCTSPAVVIPTLPPILVPICWAWKCC